MKNLFIKFLLKTAALAVVFSCVLSSWAFICLAFYLWLSSSQGEIAAALWTALINLLLVFIIVLLSYHPLLRRKKYGNSIPLIMGEALGKNFSTWTRQHTLDGLITVLCAGFLLGFSSRLRALLLRLLR